MTISSTTRKAGPFACNGVTVAFPFAFKVFATSDVVVTRTDTTPNDTVLTLGSDYTVALNADQNALPGGTVTLTVAPATGYVVTLSSGVPQTQLISLQNLGGFNPSTINDGFDKTTILLQQMNEQLGRAVTVPISGGYTPAQLIALITAAAATTPYNLNVKAFGATGLGVVDDTSAIQNAINAASASLRTVFFPAGTYKITAPLVVSGTTTLVGDGPSSTTIKQYTNNVAIISASGSANCFRNFSLTYSPTPIAGATALTSSGTNTYIQDVIVSNCYIGFSFTSGGNIQFAHGFQITNYVSVGILVQGLISDIYCSNFILNAGNTTNGALGGIRLMDGVNGAMFTNGDIVNGVYSLTTDATTYAAPSRPAYSFFTNIYFNSATQGSSINKMVLSNFVNCQFSNLASSNNNGLTLDQTDSLRFTDCQFFNNGGYGCAVLVNTKRVMFKGCAFNDNSQAAGSGVAHGIVFSANVTDFSVQGCSASNGLYPGGKQGYGIIVNSGTSDRYVISDNLVSGNITGGVSDSGSGVNKRIANNY